MTPLSALTPGTRFTVNQRSGTLLSVGPCRARVRWDGTDKTVTVGDRSFTASGAITDSIAPGTEVEVQP